MNRARLIVGVVSSFLVGASLGCATSNGSMPVPSTKEIRSAPDLRRAPGPGIRRTLLGRQPAHEAGWETRLYLIEFPPGATAPVHVHPAVGVGWVLAGEFESAFGDEPLVEVRAGEGFADKADVPHRVFRNPSTDHELRFIVAYTIRAGDEPFRVLE